MRKRLKKRSKILNSKIIQYKQFVRYAYLIFRRMIKLEKLHANIFIIQNVLTTGAKLL